MEKSETNYELFIQHVFNPDIVQFMYTRRHIINEWSRIATILLINDVKGKDLTLDEFIVIYNELKKDWDDYNNGGIVIDVLQPE